MIDVDLQHFTHHDLRLVALAMATGLLASVVSLGLFKRALACRGRSRLIWLGLNAAACGYGIFATHAIAMLGAHIADPAAYDFGLALLSLAVAILATGTGVAIAVRDNSPWAGAIGGAVVGLGISAIHAIEVLGFDVPRQVDWSATTWIASLLLSAGFGSLAFHLAIHRHRLSIMLTASALLTAALIADHVLAIGTTAFQPVRSHAIAGGPLSHAATSFVLAGVAVAILGACFIAALSDSRIRAVLAQQRLLLDTAIENMPQGLCMFDAAGRAMLFNARYAAMSSVPAATLRGMSLRDQLEYRQAAGDFDGDPDQYFADVMAEMAAGRPAVREVDFGGRVLRVTEQPVQGSGWVATVEDVTKWHEANQLIAYQALHDPLTQLPNRTKFHNEFAHVLQHAIHDSWIAVLFLDLDRFKQVNDSFGHAVGDTLLHEVSQRLLGCIRSDDTVARLGGDEFAVIQIVNDGDLSDVTALAARIVEVLGAPYAIQGHDIVVGASVGIALSPRDGTTPDELLRKADAALYRAKESGRSAYRFYESGMTGHAQARPARDAVEVAAPSLQPSRSAHARNRNDVTT
ncbi:MULTISPECIES: diguanylate cyclase [Rhodopseudomonas]|nr:MULTISPECIES: diguanylate cyclase [Rhodopseudomonas]MDF3813477.1 diguanylate cyclase [Rhodopseudomonas sp. BAL398]